VLTLVLVTILSLVTLLWFVESTERAVISARREGHFVAASDDPANDSATGDGYPMQQLEPNQVVSMPRRLLPETLLWRWPFSNRWAVVFPDKLANWMFQCIDPVQRALSEVKEVCAVEPE